MNKTHWTFFWNVGVTSSPPRAQARARGVRGSTTRDRADREIPTPPAPGCLGAAGRTRSPSCPLFRTRLILMRPPLSSVRDPLRYALTNNKQKICLFGP